MKEEIKITQTEIDKMAGVDIQIKNESGIGYVLLNLLPIILPVLVLIIFIWIL